MSYVLKIYPFFIPPLALALVLPPIAPALVPSPPRPEPPDPQLEFDSPQDSPPPSEDRMPPPSPTRTRSTPSYVPSERSEPLALIRAPPPTALVMALTLTPQTSI